MQKVICSIRRKLVLSILLIVLAALGVFVFAACSDDITEDTFRARGYKVTVTYDYQGGSANGKDSVRILVKENSKLPAPISSGGVGVPFKTGYSFKGFYVAETDDDGKLVYDDDGNISVTDKAWNFKTDSVTNKDVTLCAKWWENYKVVLHYGDNYAQNTEIDLPRNTEGKPNTIMSSALDVSGYTFLSYNLVKDSADASTAIDKFPYDFSEFVNDSSSLKIDVWGKSLTGKYVLVRSARDLSISAVSEQTNYYLLNDIDMAGAKYNDETSSNKLPKSYGGKFVGNGHTISNFSINLKALDRSYANFGLFRTLDSGAEITDVTFNNVNLSYDLSDSSITSYYVGMLAGQASSGAVIRNVNITASEQGNSLFEYLVGVGVDKTKLNIAADLLIAQKPASVEFSGCAATNVKRIASVGVVTADEEYMLYVKYTEDNGTIVLGNDAIYKLAQKSKNGGYSEKTISSTEFVGENKFVLTRLGNNVFDVTFTVNNGELSATMVKR